MESIKPNDRVRLTAQFLRNTGQIKGPDGAQTWIVKYVRGNIAHVNEPADLSFYTDEELTAEPWLLYRVGTFSFYTDEELTAEPWLKWRAINVANLYRVGTLTARNAV